MSSEFDLVIKSGRVMDPETMYDQVANVGVKHGQIAAITMDEISGDETIDAAGLVVAPGFIDTHFHAVDRFATKLALRDGTTTGMDLELGATAVESWYANKQREGWQVNFGTTSSLNLNRLLVHDPEVEVTEALDWSNAPGYLSKAAEDGHPGWSVSRSSVDQINAIMQLLDADLRDGALGIGVGAAYMARGMTSYEQFIAQRTAARYGRLTSVHTRFHLSSETPMEAPIALDEVLVNAMLLKAPLILCHDNDYGWWENEEKLRMARAQGHNVWGEYYPYDAGSTGVGADFLRPELWEEIYGYRYEETVYDPLEDRFLTKKQFLDAVATNPASTVVVYLPQRRRWMSNWLRIPHMTVATDAMAGVGTDGNVLPWDADYTRYAGHPRTAGCFARALRLAREESVPLMFTLSQLSYWSALHLGETGLEAMRQRGRIQVGKIADITLFEADTVTDNATYKAGENGLPSTGIPYVIVSGTIVVKDSEVLPVRPGQPIRFPVEANGRFGPVDEGSWLGQHAIAVPGHPYVDDTGAATRSA